MPAKDFWSATIMVSSIVVILALNFSHDFFKSIALEVELTENTGIITSPIYPKYDYTGVDRKYRIIIDLGSKILLTITHLMVRMNSELKVSDGKIENENCEFNFSEFKIS